MKGVVYCVKGMRSQRADVWDRDLGDESRDVSEDVSHRENT